MFKLSRKDKSTGGITHVIEQENDFLSADNIKDWQAYGDFDLIVFDMTQENLDHLAKPEKVEGHSVNRGYF